jgi:hypothetical protein
VSDRQFRHALDTYLTGEYADAVSAYPVNWEDSIEGVVPFIRTGGYDDYDANSADNAPEPEAWWYFTFGGDHLYANRFVALHGTYMGARMQMLNRFGNDWCSQMSEGSKPEDIDRYGLVELIIDRGDSAGLADHVPPF